MIKALPISSPMGVKLQARSNTVYSGCEPAREQVFWENFRRRKRQLNRQGYWAGNWRPYEELGKPLCLEPKTLTLKTLGPLDETAKDEPVTSGEVTLSKTFHELAAGSQCLKLNQTRSQKKEDIVALRKHLYHTRRLVSAVRQGRGYFHLLQREEQHAQEAHLRERRRHEEASRVECQPPGSESDGETPEEGRRAGSVSPTVRSWSSRARPRRVKTLSARPFTPIHRSLISPHQSSAPLEPAFRQLCCLNWLLEALTLDPAGRAGPISSCWDLKDPGRSRTTLKALNREKAIETKWCQFVLQPKPRKMPLEAQRTVSGRPSLQTSALAVLALGSLSSLVPEEMAPFRGESGSMEDPEDEPPDSDYLRKLLDAVYQSTSKESHGTQHSSDRHPESLSLVERLSVGKNPAGPNTIALRPKSSPGRKLSANSRFMDRKSSVFDKTKVTFQESLPEPALSLNNTLESKAKQRWENSVKRFQALCRGGVQHDPPQMTTPGDAKATEAEDLPQDTAWLSELLSSLPKEALEDRRVSQVREKLARLADAGSPRACPQLFLKVLGGLQPWELCSPDLCVAIEIVREHVIRMTKEDYDTWLQSRITLSLRAQSAPHIRQTPFSQELGRSSLNYITGY